ncbi:hypothetical protein [Lagierella sp.]|uniref:hypothetical protein n=1 Tax=Lagierella sp. TaxID=2849657 RepID=UPI00262C2BAA|nr:hypothetical protein [Lagierella sp.]
MLVVKDSSPKDLEYIKEKFNLEFSHDYTVPEIFFTIFEESDIIGYSRIIIKDNKPYLADLIVEGDYGFYDMDFFLKATASKVLDLGFEYLYFNYIEKLEKILINSPAYIPDLLKGNCSKNV